MIDGKQLGDALDAIYNPPHPSEQFRKDVSRSLEAKGLRVIFSDTPSGYLQTRIERGDTAYVVDVSYRELHDKAGAYQVARYVINSATASLFP